MTVSWSQLRRVRDDATCWSLDSPRARRLGARRSLLPRDLAAVLALSLSLWLVYGDGWIGYDSSYALLWGADVTSGRLPDLRAEGTPTPHPLATGAAALLSVIGAGAFPVTEALSVVAFATLGIAAFKLGRAAVSAPVGLAFALLLLTRPGLVDGMLEASIDLPFLALVVGSGAVLCRTPVRWRLALGLLAAASLLRPEAWPLTWALIAYLLLVQRVRPTAQILVLGAGPAVWAAHDLLLTGNPLFSFTHTRVTAEQIARPRGLAPALSALPSYLEADLDQAVLFGGLLGCVLVAMGLQRGAWLAAAVLVAGACGFLILGLTGLPLIPRYVAMPVSALALLCAVAMFGWLRADVPARVRLGWAIGAAVLIVAVVASFPATVRKLDVSTDSYRLRDPAQEDFRDLARRPIVRRLTERCERVRVPNARLVPIAAYLLNRSRSAVTWGPPSRDAGTLYVDSTSRAGADAFDIGGQAGAASPSARSLPRGSVRTSFWVAHASC